MPLIYMQKIIFIVVYFICIVSKSTKAQGVPDTLAYLQGFVANKAQYIGKPFSKLLDSLKVQIKYFHPRSDIAYDISKETSTRFGFSFPHVADDMYLTYPSLEIYWQPPYLNANNSYILYNNNNGGSWSSVVASFYSTGIVADVKVRE